MDMHPWRKAERSSAMLHIATFCVDAALLVVGITDLILRAARHRKNKGKKSKSA
jgi:hypothetical protein